MARKPRIHFPGAFYHVISRGNQGQTVFHDDADRNRYLSLLEELPNRFRCKLYAYVLMGNHVHLLVEVTAIALAKIMQNLQFRYTQYYKEGKVSGFCNLLFMCAQAGQLKYKKVKA